MHLSDGAGMSYDVEIGEAGNAGYNPLTSVIVTGFRTSMKEKDRRWAGV